MTVKEGSLGDPIEIWCRYCRLNLDAVVSAVKDGAVAKVQCRTCKHFQDYKAPVPATAQRERLIRRVMSLAERRGVGPTRASSSSKPATTKEPLSSEALARAMWEEATRDASALRAKVYDQHRKFADGDVILHKAHGMGVVREVRDDDSTILALFREGIKRLEHDRPNEDE
jgi:hypothetical protein